MEQEVKEKSKKEYKKRTKGVYNISCGMYDIYKFYRTRSKKPINKILFRAIINDLNLKIRDRIINESEYFKMPYNLGTIRIRKSGIGFSLYNLDKFPINYKLTREFGKVIYHDTEYIYRWKWVKYKVPLKWKSVYKFEPCRAAKRLLAKAILVDKKDYFFER